MNKYIIAIMALVVISGNASGSDQGGRSRTRAGAPSSEAAMTASAQALIDKLKSDPNWQGNFNSTVNGYSSVLGKSPKPCDAYQPMSNDRIRCDSDVQSANSSADSSFKVLMYLSGIKSTPQIEAAAREQFRAMARNEALKNKKMISPQWNTFKW